MLNDNECITTYATCEAMPNENTHYEGHIIRYLDTYDNIDNLPMGKVLLVDLEKVGLIVLKCDYSITPNSNEQYHFYVLNKCYME